MSQPIRILLTGRNAAQPGEHHTYMDALRARGFEFLTHTDPLKTAAEVLAVYDRHWPLAATVASIEPYPAEVLAALSHRAGKWRFMLSRNGVGYDKVDIKAAAEHGVPLAITPGSNQEAVAQHTVALMLASLCSLVSAHTLVQNRQWRGVPAWEAADKRFLCIGLGRIGREVAKRVLALGMHVDAYDPYLDLPFVAAMNSAMSAPCLGQTRWRLEGGNLVSERYWPQITPVADAALIEALGKADVVSLHLDVRPETVGFVNREFVSKMKPGAVLVNCARGRLVVEADVAAAAASGHIIYAADVFEPEPIPADSPLLGNPGVLTTPHLAAGHKETIARQTAMAIANVVAWLEGKPPLQWIVPPAA